MLGSPRAVDPVAELSPGATPRLDFSPVAVSFIPSDMLASRTVSFGPDFRPFIFRPNPAVLPSLFLIAKLIGERLQRIFGRRALFDDRGLERRHRLRIRYRFRLQICE